MKNNRIGLVLNCIGLVLFGIVFVLTLIVAARSFGAEPVQVRVMWDPNTEADLAGYRLRSGTNSGAFQKVFDVGMTNQSVVTITNWPVYITVTAYNTSGLESDPSNELALLGLPESPKGAAIEVITQIQVIVTNTIVIP